MSTEIQKDAAKPAAQGIDVGRLERELAANWQKAAGGAAEESGVTRVCVLNLIVYATERDDRAKIDALLDVVTEHVPSRVLMLVADRSAAEAKLEAKVSTRCQSESVGAKRICGEQVTVEAAGAGVETAASAIEPLVVPDVPVFLWWKDIPHEDDKLFNRLVEMSDRVVIDTLACDSPHEDLLRLAQIIEKYRQYILASDLNWGRLTAWRNLIASFWDVADYREHLNGIDGIVIEYDPPDESKGEVAAQALLVAGWLASRLKWQVGGEFQRDAGGVRWTLGAGGGREIALEMRATADRHDCDGLIASLTLKASGAEFYAAVNQEWTKLETSAKIGDAQKVGRVVAYEAKSEGQRLSRELGLLTRDAVYEESVATASRLIEALKKS